MRHAIDNLETYLKTASTLEALGRVASLDEGHFDVTFSTTRQVEWAFLEEATLSCPAFARGVFESIRGG